MKRLFILFLAVVLAGMIQFAEAQWPGSVTSPAPGRQVLPPPSVTATGPQGFHAHRFVPHNGFVFGHGRHFRNGFGAYGAYGSSIFSGPVFGYAPYPYYMYDDPGYGYEQTSPPPNASGNMYQPDPNYAGEYGLREPLKKPAPSQPASASDTSNEGPTKSEANSNEAAKTTTTASAATVPAPPKAQPSTILVFKDGHRLEVTNYVIQGATLFNLGDSGPRKVAIADLDIDSTMNVNDERGVEFSLP